MAQSDKTVPSISVRTSIRWLPDAASEPTSTLVLTASSRRFVDIRILKPQSPEDEDLPNKGGPMTRLEWAFAGTSSTTLLPAPTEPSKAAIVHSKWSHWIDSNTDDAVVDEGDMFPQPDGSTLECGAMVNPATRRLTPYEEVWGDEHVVATAVESTGSGVSAGVSAGSDEQNRKRWSVVLVLDDEANKAKGMVVRVGQYCQGIVKVQGEVCVERWQWVVEEGESGVKGNWKRLARLGRLFLPCAVAFEPGRIVEGSKVTYGDYEWEVQELYSW